MRVERGSSLNIEVDIIFLFRTLRSEMPFIAKFQIGFYAHKRNMRGFVLILQKLYRV